jgi:PAS domain S-box-containing protein
LGLILLNKPKGIEVTNHKVKTYLAAHQWLSKNAEIYQSDRLHSFEIISKKCTEVMDVERVGIWFFSMDHESIQEEITFIRDGQSTQGAILEKSDFPVYFKRIKEEGIVLTRDTFKEPFSSSALEDYMTSRGVHAILDVPIFSDGSLIGIVSIEKQGVPRDWDEPDICFATVFSDVIGRIVEAEKRHSFEDKLQNRIENLQFHLKNKMEKLTESNLSLEFALDSAQIGKWDWDIKTNSLKLSGSWFTKLGFYIDELPPTFETFKKLVHPEDVERVLKELEKNLSGNKLIFENRYRMMKKNGDVQWCLDRGMVIASDEDGKPTKMIGLNVDITPLMKYEEAVVQSEKQLKSMISSLPTAVAMFDRELNYLAFSSKWHEEWSALTQAEEGRTVRHLIQEKWIATMERVLKGENAGQEEELVDVGDGKQFWIRWAMRPWVDARGEIGGIIFLAEDISKRKEAEMYLTQSSKLSALGEMAGGIAHEINNPLSIIKGYVDLLKRHSLRNTLSPVILDQYITKIDQTVSRISKIVAGMRKFSRESSKDEKVHYSIRKIIEETLDICQEKINNHGTIINIEYPKHLIEVYCRPVEVSQVLLNLINNSFQAISASHHSWINITSYETDNSVSIKIVDSGKSIPSEIKAKLFQPFFTTKEIGVGTGLGLSISRGIIEEHGGKLYLKEGEPNTTFIVELPKA